MPSRFPPGWHFYIPNGGIPRKIPLSDRLLACCNFVKRGDRVADVGCDHGYLGIYLLTQSIAKSVIESDVAEGPLQIAMRNAVK